MKNETKKNNREYYTEILNKYKINNKLIEGNIFHLYCKKEAYPNGYYDSKFFDLWVFNTDKMTKRLIEDRDGLTFVGNAKVDIVRYYIDGSTLIRLETIQPIVILKDVIIGNYNETNR